MIPEGHGCGPTPRAETTEDKLWDLSVRTWLLSAWVVALLLLIVWTNMVRIADLEEKLELNQERMQEQIAALNVRVQTIVLESAGGNK